MEVTVSASVGDGSCFFDSIAQILRSGGHDATIQTIRQVVASTVLDADDDAATATMLQWRELAYGALKERDAAMIEEFGHAFVLLDAAYIASVDVVAGSPAAGAAAGPAPISDECRQRLYDVMMTPRYQGEEYALRVLESKLGVRCRVYQTSSRGGGGSGYWHHGVVGDNDSDNDGGSVSPSPKYVCALLHTDGRHYEPMAFNGDFLFYYHRGLQSS